MLEQRTHIRYSSEPVPDDVIRSVAAAVAAELSPAVIDRDAFDNIPDNAFLAGFPSGRYPNADKPATVAANRLIRAGNATLRLPDDNPRPSRPQRDIPVIPDFRNGRFGDFRVAGQQSGHRTNGMMMTERNDDKTRPNRLPAAGSRPGRVSRRNSRRDPGRPQPDGTEPAGRVPDGVSERLRPGTATSRRHPTG